MDALRNNKDAVAATLVGAAIAGSTALLGLYLAKRNQRATRRATLKCACGKVQAEIYQPAANYKYAEVSNMQCACNDCMGYCKAVLKEGSTEDAFQKGFFDPAVPTVVLYDSEIQLTKGMENIEHMKLSRKTENRRTFAKCCGTPLAICPDHSHLNLVYCNLLTPTKNCGTDEIPFPAPVLDHPTVCLHASSSGITVDDVQIKHKHSNMKVISGVGAPIEILKIVSRLGLLLVMGSRGPGQGFPVASGKTVGIGYDSIPKQMKSAD